MKKEEPKRYEIDTFEKLVNVANMENIERLTIDFLSWLTYTTQIIDNARKTHPTVCKGKTYWEIIQSTFIWIDDGKNGLENVIIKNRNTGEQKTINLKK